MAAFRRRLSTPPSDRIAHRSEALRLDPGLERDEQMASAPLSGWLGSDD